MSNLDKTPSNYAQMVAPWLLFIALIVLFGRIAPALLH
jgi:hypothetical protein